MDMLIKYLLNFRLLYMIVGGFIFYLLSVLIDPIFIPSLPMQENFCRKRIETRSGYQKQSECVEFGNKLDELKYRHNQKMERRRANKMMGLFIAASVVTFLLMVLNPSIFFGFGVSIENYTGAVATAVFYGVILGFILPTVFSILLPPPIQWLPQELAEIRNARTQFVLAEIIKLSK
jgi:hypothetical protein